VKKEHAAVGDRETVIDLVEQRPLYEGFRRYTEYDFRENNHPSGHGDPHEHAPIRREMLESHRTIAVLPYDGSSGDIILINQFRIGAHLATGRGMLVEIVAGYVDEGEDAETAARRELTEETGLEALEMVKAAEFLPSPGMTTEFVTFFVARVDASGLLARAGLEAEEKIFPFRCTLDEALEAADGFAISNVFTLFALNWFARNRACFLHSERPASA
jgi:ADP-ribose pyrophosphatase